ncbi:hypothetical protein HKX48_001847 [Thoreauomyces humboldtii]|nr:hypothetical protein HKX48_001847 [Thoreauomyces humboldtii]
MPGIVKHSSQAPPESLPTQPLKVPKPKKPAPTVGEILTALKSSIEDFSDKESHHDTFVGTINCLTGNGNLGYIKPDNDKVTLASCNLTPDEIASIPTDVVSDGTRSKFVEVLNVRKFVDRSARCCQSLDGNGKARNDRYSGVTDGIALVCLFKRWMDFGQAVYEEIEDGRLKVSKKVQTACMEPWPHILYDDNEVFSQYLHKTSKLLIKSLPHLTKTPLSPLVTSGEFLHQLSRRIGPTSLLLCRTVDLHPSRLLKTLLKDKPARQAFLEAVDDDGAFRTVVRDRMESGDGKVVAALEVFLETVAGAREWKDVLAVCEASNVVDGDDDHEGDGEKRGEKRGVEEVEVEDGREGDAKKQKVE